MKTGGKFGLAGRRRSGVAGYSFAEFIVALGITTVLGAVLLSAAMTIRRSLNATSQYLISTNNANRIIDYVGRDLTRAVRVGQLIGATNTAFKTQANFAVTETNTLTINIPDYYVSNTPDNLTGSTYKTPRWSRASLGTGVVAWADAQITVGAVPMARYAPSTGTDEIQVRYYRSARSGTDATRCYFRREHHATSGASLSPAVEIAEQVVDAISTTALIVTGLNNGKQFQLQSNFTPRYRFSSAGGLSTPTTQLREFNVQNPRRD